MSASGVWQGALPAASFCFYNANLNLLVLFCKRWVGLFARFSECRSHIGLYAKVITVIPAPPNCGCSSRYDATPGVVSRA